MAGECLKQAEAIREFHGEPRLANRYPADEAIKAADGREGSAGTGDIIEMPDSRRLYVRIQEYLFKRVRLFEFQPGQTEPDTNGPTLIVDRKPEGLDQHDHF